MTDGKAPQIKDFDAVAPARRVARIAGREVDVTSIPARVTLDMARFKDDLDAGKLTQEEQIARTVELVAKVTVARNPEITADWLLDNTTLDTLFDFIGFVLAPTTQRAKEYEEKQGNGEPASS